MREGLYCLSGDENSCLCRAVISASAILTSTLIDWIRGHVSPAGLAESLLKNDEQVMIQEVSSGLSEGESANICSAVAPYLGGLQEGQEIPYWQQMIGGDEWEYYYVPQDMRFWVAVTDPKNFPILESGMFQVSLLEVKAIDIQFVKETAVVTPWKIPENYITGNIPSSGDHLVCAPSQTSWSYDRGEFNVSAFYFSNQYTSSAYLVLNYRHVISVDPLPDWYFLNQSGKEYHLSFGFDFYLGLTATITNHYDDSETPQDCVPFFSADYPVSVAPYKRIEGSGYRRLYGYYGRGGMPEMKIPSNSNDRAYVIPTDRIAAKEIGASGIVPLSIAALALIWQYKKRR